MSFEQLVTSDEAVSWFEKFSALPEFWHRYTTILWDGSPAYLKYFGPQHKIANISDCTSFEEAILKNEIAGNEQAVRELKLLREFDEFVEHKKLQEKMR